MTEDEWLSAVNEEKRLLLLIFLAHGGASGTKAGVGAGLKAVEEAIARMDAAGKAYIKELDPH